MSDADHRPMSKAELEAYIADDFIPAMRKMLPAIAPLPEWQPIETAPRDGTDVLCISGEYMFVAWIDSRGYWNSGDDSRFVPDYWMYLPKPPAAKEGKPSA